MGWGWVQTRAPGSRCLCSPSCSTPGRSHNQRRWTKGDTDERTRGGDGWQQQMMKRQGNEVTESMGGGEREREVRGRLGVHRKVLTHSLCLLIIRSMSSLIFLYLSSDSGLWPTESSASGSGLSQPFRPFFLNVCKQSSCTTWLKGLCSGEQ